MTASPARVLRRAAAVLVLMLLGSGLTAAAGPNPDATSPDDRGAVAVVEVGAGPGDAGDASVAGRVSVSPLLLRLAQVPRQGREKSTVQVRATVSNLGGTRLAGVTVALVAPPGVALKPAGAVSIRHLVAGAEATATWTLCAATAGAHLVFATATIGGVTIQSRALSVTLPGGRC